MAIGELVHCGIVARDGVDDGGIRYPFSVWAKYPFFPLQIAQTSTDTLPPICPFNGRQGIFCWGGGGLLISRGVKLTSHLSLLPRLRMRGAIPLLARILSLRGAY
jgi:hypothetical protein